MSVFIGMSYRLKFNQDKSELEASFISFEVIPLGINDRP
jgi:hypothetical protein